MLDNRIALAGFNLEASEQTKVNSLLETYITRVESIVKDYEELKLTLKTKQHAKTFLHEVHGELIVKGKVIASRETDHNLMKALSKVFERLLEGVRQSVLKWKNHKLRTPQKTRKERK